MKAPNNAKAPIEDSDIAQVFAAQDIAPPEALRQSILDQAAIHAGQAGHTGDAVAQRSRNSVWTSRMAIAATVLMAIVIAPVLLRAPESSLDNMSAAPQPQAVSEQRSDVVQPESTAANTLSNSSEPADAALQEFSQTEEVSIGSTHSLAAPERAAAPDKGGSAGDTADSLSDEPTGELMKTPTTHRAERSTAAASSDALTTKSSLSYRNAADTWINEIKVLIADGKVDDARREYELFEQQYPDKAAEFTPDYSRQIQQDPDNALDRER